MRKTDMLKIAGMFEEIAKIMREGAEECENVPDSAAEKEVEKVSEETSENESESDVSLEELSKMKFADLKKFAKERNISTEGTRKDIIARILEGETSEPETAEEEPAEESEDDEFMATAKAVAEETSDDDIREALTDAGIKVSKKADHDKILELLAKALKDGVINLEDDEDETPNNDEEEAEEPDDSPSEDEAEDSDEESDEEEEITEDSYFKEYDPDGVNDPKNMNDKRKKAVKKMMKRTITAIESGKIDRDAIDDFLGDNCTEEESEEIEKFESDDELIAYYLEMKKRYIDDEGEERTPNDPYELNGEDYCCGHKLKYDEKNKTYICEVCGQDYEAE